MEHINRSVYAAYMQTCQYLGITPEYVRNTTLNEALDIQKTAIPGTTERSTLNYYVWGNKGHEFTKGADGIARTLIVPHRATDGNLYGLLPLVLREHNNDLSAVQRDKYILRKEVTYGGRNYYGYYGRRIDKTNVVVTMNYVTVNPDTGKETITTFVPSTANLKPTPPVLSQEGSYVTSGDYVTVKARISLDIDSTEVNEMLNVSRIIYGHDSYAMFTEIGLCMGVDRVVNVAGYNGSTFNFREGIAVQIASFVNVMYDLRFANDGLDVNIDVGANEPLFRLTEADRQSAQASTAVTVS